jgi:hypothetical protein
MPLPQLVSRSVFFQTFLLITLLGVSMPAANASSQQLSCNPRSLWFGKVVVGQPQNQPATLTNNGSSSVTVTEVGVNNPAFAVNGLNLPVTIAAGQNVNFTITFTPATTGNVNGVVTFTSNASNRTLNVGVGGKGVNDWALQANPTSLAFGSVLVGSSSTLPMTILNAGSTAETINIGQVGGLGYSVSGVKLPLTLEAGQSFTFSVTFAPTVVGPSAGTIVATSPLSPTLTIPLSGTGATAGQLTVSPATMNFGSVNVGQNSSQGGQLTAGTSTVIVSSATMSNPAFALSGITLPATIPAGQALNYTVTFTPQSGGTISGTLSFASNAANSPSVEALTGTGNPVPYSVNLSWNPSDSQVVGYNVYRSNQSGGPYNKINSALDPNTAYDDTTVVAGQTYYYATTAVNSGGEESSYSNLAEVVIP